MSPYDNMNPMMTNPYVNQGAGQPMAAMNPYMQNTQDQMANQQMAMQQGMQNTQNAGRVTNTPMPSMGGGGTGAMMAAGLRKLGGGVADLANQGLTSGGMKYGTNAGSEQSMELARQEEGLYR
jgi:hypothetical protein